MSGSLSYAALLYLYISQRGRGKLSPLLLLLLEARFELGGYDISSVKVYNTLHNC